MTRAVSGHSLLTGLVFLIELEYLISLKQTKWDQIKKKKKKKHEVVIGKVRFRNVA